MNAPDGLTFCNECGVSTQCARCRREANRLTDADRVRITGALSTFLAATERMEAGERVTTAERVARHAIGCSAADLRDSELTEIADTVRTYIAARAEATA